MKTNTDIINSLAHYNSLLNTKPSINLNPLHYKIPANNYKYKKYIEKQKKINNNYLLHNLIEVRKSPSQLRNIGMKTPRRKQSMRSEYKQKVRNMQIKKQNEYLQMRIRSVKSQKKRSYELKGNMNNINRSNKVEFELFYQQQLFNQFKKASQSYGKGQYNIKLKRHNRRKRYGSNTQASQYKSYSKIENDLIDNFNDKATQNQIKHES